MKRNKRAEDSEIDLLIDGAGTEHLSTALRGVHERLALGRSTTPDERFVARLRSTLDRERLGFGRRATGRNHLVSARWLAAALVVLLIGGLGVATTLRFGGVHQLDSTPGSRPGGGVSLPAATPSRRKPIVAVPSRAATVVISTGSYPSMNRPMTEVLTTANRVWCTAKVPGVWIGTTAVIRFQRLRQATLRDHDYFVFPLRVTAEHMLVTFVTLNTYVNGPLPAGKWRCVVEAGKNQIGSADFTVVAALPTLPPAGSARTPDARPILTPSPARTAPVPGLTLTPSPARTAPAPGPILTPCPARTACGSARDGASSSLRGGLGVATASRAGSVRQPRAAAGPRPSGGPSLPTATASDPVAVPTSAPSGPVAIPTLVPAGPVAKPTAAPAGRVARPAPAPAAVLSTVHVYLDSSSTPLVQTSRIGAADHVTCVATVPGARQGTPLLFVFQRFGQAVYLDYANRRAVVRAASKPVAGVLAGPLQAGAWRCVVQQSGKIVGAAEFTVGPASRALPVAGSARTPTPCPSGATASCGEQSMPRPRPTLTPCATGSACGSTGNAASAVPRGVPSAR